MKTILTPIAFGTEGTASCAEKKIYKLKEGKITLINLNITLHIMSNYLYSFKFYAYAGFKRFQNLFYCKKYLLTPWSPHKKVNL